VLDRTVVRAKCKLMLQKKRHVVLGTGVEPPRFLPDNSERTHRCQLLSTSVQTSLWLESGKCYHLRGCHKEESVDHLLLCRVASKSLVEDMEVGYFDALEYLFSPPGRASFDTT
jgi:hypothetical protein